MAEINELVGTEWPLSEETKIRLAEQRRKRREQVLSDPANRKVYDETKLAYDVSQMLREARREAHLTQKQVAERVRTSQSNLARLEKGQNVKLTTLYSYAKACGKRVEVRLV